MTTLAERHERLDRSIADAAQERALRAIYDKQNLPEHLALVKNVIHDIEAYQLPGNAGTIEALLQYEIAIRRRILATTKV